MKEGVENGWEILSESPKLRHKTLKQRRIKTILFLRTLRHNEDANRGDEQGEREGGRSSINFNDG